MPRPTRIDYDSIAPLYDGQPYRGKSPDPELAAFIARRAPSPLSLLDVACGTGSQLVANRALAPAARLVGADHSLGMLRQAQPKAADIAWVRADAAALPFGSATFDFVSCQFAFHHLPDKRAMLREALRVLRPSGRLVIHNLCPEKSEDWLCYTYFPASRVRDRADFWPAPTLLAEMIGAGFAAVTADYRHVRFAHDLVELLATARRRDTNSQLMSIPDDAYTAGLSQVERELAQAGGALTRDDHLCFATVRGDKR